MALPWLGFLFKIIGFVIASFLLIHFLAFLGVFAAIAYPLWWLVAPKQIFCFGCLIFNHCPFCGEESNRVRRAPKSFAATIFNGFFILLISLLCLGVVFLESQLLFRMGFPPTPKTVSFVIPAKGQYRLGELFTVPIQVAGVGKPINVVQADIGFDPKIVEAVEISTKGSFANIFLQKEIDNKIGYVRLTGGLSNPGFAGESGTFGLVFFRGISPGLVRIEFLPSSMVLANDGRGTNVLKDLASSSYLILPEKISDQEREEQEVILTPEVLGEETAGSEETSLVFYEERQVLGTSVGDKVEKDGRENFGTQLLSLWERMVAGILNFWYRFFQGVKGLFATS